MIQASTQNLVPDLAWPPECRRWPPVFPPICACAWGDDRYGLWIDVVIGGPMQRFRWIEPGEFVMGSPEGEEGRFDNEGPQHIVRLTEGFWLADTACSQLVWQAVMGSNPSRFNDDPQNPVEQVSWDDVQDFLRDVGKRLPGMKADLPTEAQWEYACRAGSETAFSWGKDIDPAQANCNFGEGRGKTVPVKSYAPNGWGLYQMHGNVWEWCADGLRDYDYETQTDPRGPEWDKPVPPCAVRGGSWLGDLPALRAACRNQRPRSDRHVSRGFRFHMKSMSPEACAECPPEVVVARDA